MRWMKASDQLDTEILLRIRLENRERRLTLGALLKPYTKSLGIVLVAVVGGGVADLLQPWPLKIVFDMVGGSKPVHGWLKTFVHSEFGPHKTATIEFAAVAVIVIAGLGAHCSYVESYMTSSVGQWVTHDLRSLMYNHIQHLSLRYHTQKQTGDLISRLTTDVDAVQSFIVSGVVGLITDCVTLLGMAAVMLYLNWRFTLIALSVAPVLFALTYPFLLTNEKRVARMVVSWRDG
jgi:subfamily B ATP-binding cassette protein MsbA